jgi:hypothetical protein
MNRRELILVLGGASAVWPVVGWAQQGGRHATIGLMGASTDRGLCAETG